MECYARPKDQHGLLLHWRETILPAMLEAVLLKYNVRTVLDCSCGAGLYAVELAKNQAWQVSAADPCAEAGNRLRQRMQEHGVNIPFRRTGAGVS